MKEFANLVKDKNVLLVGNGSSVKNKDYSELIDSYEFVIRFNYAIRKFYEFKSSGHKIDGWFYSIKCPNTCNTVYNDAKIKAKHCIRHDYEPLDIGENQYHIPSEPYRKKFNESLNIKGKNKKASTGLCAIHYLVEYCEPESISIIGFDSFNTSNFWCDPNYNIAHRWHFGDIEKQYLNKLLKENKISILDNYEDNYNQST